MRRAGRNTARRPRGGKLLCRVCGARVTHGQAWNITERLFTCTCLVCKERAESQRDTGWQRLATVHGPRFHRVIGTGLELDVEEGAAGLSWVASAVRDRSLVAVRVGLASAADAAAAIEIAANVEPRPLPAEGCDHG